MSLLVAVAARYVHSLTFLEQRASLAVPYALRVSEASVRPLAGCCYVTKVEEPFSDSILGYGMAFYRPGLIHAPRTGSEHSRRYQSR